MGMFSLNMEKNKLTEVGAETLWDALLTRTRAELQAQPHYRYATLETARMFL